MLQTDTWTIGLPPAWLFLWAHECLDTPKHGPWALPKGSPSNNWCFLKYQQGLIMCFRSTAWGTFRTFNTLATYDWHPGFWPTIRVSPPFVSLKPILGKGIKNYGKDYNWLTIITNYLWVSLDISYSFGLLPTINRMMTPLKLRLYIIINQHIYIYIYIYKQTNKYVYIYTYTYMSIYICIQLYIYIYIYALYIYML